MVTYPSGCAVDSCEGKHYGRGWCKYHYQRSYLSGALEERPRSMVQRGASMDERLRSSGWNVTSSGCWEWSGSRNHAGYGQIAGGRTAAGKPRPLLAHRAAYSIWVGEIPDGLVVRHKCDNPPCINPDHLEVGTLADNSRDAVKRMRTANGENKRSHRLTDQEVQAIREGYAPGSVKQADLAAMYGVSQQLISSIVRMERRSKPTNRPVRLAQSRAEE
jgi:DNA-binding transcriptional regulator YiaG